LNRSRSTISASILAFANARFKISIERKKKNSRQPRRQRVTVAEWVRKALRDALRTHPWTDVRKKLGVVRRAVEHSFPAGDIDTMLGEIESGYKDTNDDLR
jgi:hypothetical protein